MDDRHRALSMVVSYLSAMDSDFEKQLRATNESGQRSVVVAFNSDRVADVTQWVMKLGQRATVVMFDDAEPQLRCRFANLTVHVTPEPAIPYSDETTLGDLTKIGCSMTLRHDRSAFLDFDAGSERDVPDNAAKMLADAH